MFTYRRGLELAVLVAAVPLAAFQAQATTNTCSAVALGTFELNVCPNSAGGGVLGLSNLASSASASSFAVSVDVAPPSGSFAIPGLSGWSGQGLSETDWNLGYNAAFGSWSSLFGNAQGVYLYSVAWMGGPNGGMVPMGNLIGMGTSTGDVVNYSGNLGGRFAAWASSNGTSEVNVLQTAFTPPSATAPVPEPASAALLLAGIAGVAAVARRRHGA